MRPRCGRAGVRRSPGARTEAPRAAAARAPEAPGEAPARAVAPAAAQGRAGRAAAQGAVSGDDTLRWHGLSGARDGVRVRRRPQPGMQRHRDLRLERPLVLPGAGPRVPPRHVSRDLRAGAAGPGLHARGARLRVRGRTVQLRSDGSRVRPGSGVAVPAAGCPEPRPRIGSSCTQPGLSCDYGSCTGGVLLQCTDGSWQMVDTPCPI